MIRVQILEPLGAGQEKLIDELKNASLQIEVIDSRGMSDEELIPHIQDAQVLMLSNRPLNRKVLEACKSLRLISVAFTGLDHINLEVCAQKNITVRNASGYAVHAVAELTIALVLNLYRNIVEASQRLNAFDAALFPLGIELFGKKVGIVGGGVIGLETARLFSAFGCQVSIFHRHTLDPSIHFASQCSLEELLSTSDIVTLHIPLTKETLGFLNRDRIALMKPSSILINTARGPLIDQQSLIRALEEKRIRAAALDVFDQEPPLSKEHPICRAPHVLLTPHIGYRTQEASLSKAEIAFKNVRDWLEKSVNVLLVLLFVGCAGCNPSSLEDFHHEGASECRHLIEALKQIENREDLSKGEPHLKKRFEKMVDLIISSREFQQKHPDEEIVLGFHQELNEALKEELERIYCLEGGREIIERAQHEALLRLDAFEKNLEKQQKTLRLK